MENQILSNILISNPDFTGNRTRLVLGENSAVGITPVAVTPNGIWRTPQVAQASKLRIAAGGNADDDAAGSGAREVMLNFLDETGVERTEYLPTAGAAASGYTSANVLRLNQAEVTKHGTYPTIENPGGNTGNITFENEAAEEWGRINANFGKSHIGCCAIPKGFTGYILSAFTHVTTSQTSRTADYGFLFRDNILETAPPYSPMVYSYHFDNSADFVPVNFALPNGPFHELTDIGFIATVDSQTAICRIGYELLLIPNS